MEEDQEIDEYGLSAGKISYFLDLAQIASSQSTCIKKDVGCVLVNKQKHILAVGYNGVPANHRHCEDKALCNYDGVCDGIHAEMNALVQCKNPQDIEYAFVTLCPCWSCIKTLVATSVKYIFYLEDLDMEEDDKVKDYARKYGIELIKFQIMENILGFEIIETISVDEEDSSDTMKSDTEDDKLH